jgi:hypothetical protein
LFPDIHHEEQPSVIVLSHQGGDQGEIDFCIRVSSWEQFNDPQRRFKISRDLPRLVNPNTGTAPMFRSRRDADLTTAIYDRLPVLVRHSGEEEIKTWPVSYSTMFHMTNDSGLFRTAEQLQEQERAYRVMGCRDAASPSSERGKDDHC